MLNFLEIIQLLVEGKNRYYQQYLDTRMVPTASCDYTGNVVLFSYYYADWV